MTSPFLRYMAVKVESDVPLRYRLIGPATQHDRTDASTVPKHLVLLLDSEHRYRSVITLSRGGFPPHRLITDAFGINIEQAER